MTRTSGRAFAARQIARLQATSALNVPRPYIWRLGRRLYLIARSETDNRIEINGEAELQRRLAQSGGDLMVFDVGANVGEWTLSMLEHARAGGAHVDVHSFEPVPATFQLLEKAVGADADGNRVVPVQAALADSTGSMEIHVSSAGAGTNSLVAEAASRGRDTDAIKISTHTAVDYCSTAGIERIDLLKIDVEGFDMSVIEGARELFEAEKIGVCQFEYNHLWVFSRHYLKDVFDFAQSVTGYRVGKVTSEGIWLFDEWNPELDRFFESNYVLVHRDFEAKIGAKLGSFDRGNAVYFG